MRNLVSLIGTILLLICISCQENKVPDIKLPVPREVIDLGILVTEELPYQVWGKDLMDAFGFENANNFDVREWGFDYDDGKVSGSNAYYTLFNHGGPHIDAPKHLDLGGGLNTYKIEQFTGPLKVFDVSEYPLGRTVPVEVFEGKVEAGDVVMIYTNYVPLRSDKIPPELTTLSYEAAEYLASIPVGAFATDAWSVGANGTVPENVTNVYQREAPIHNAFLSRSIPIYEALCNVESLLDKENMLFVGTPLNIENGDGMIVRPVVLVF